MASNVLAYAANNLICKTTGNISEVATNAEWTFIYNTII